MPDIEEKASCRLQSASIYLTDEDKKFYISYLTADEDTKKKVLDLLREYM